MELDHAYDILMLSYGTPMVEVKRAYHLAAQLVHPDKLIDLPDNVRQHAEERFKQVNEAYQTLSDYIQANGAPPKPEWQPAEEWNHRVSSSSAANFVDQDYAPHVERNSDIAFAEFVGRESLRTGHRFEFDRTTLNVIAIILFGSAMLIRGCMYSSIKRELHPKPQSVDTVQTQPQDNGY